MKMALLSTRTVMALLLAAASFAPAQISRAAEDEPTVEDVEAARLCARETRVAGQAFADVRDSVRAGGTSRAQALLTVAENALRDARSACRGNDEVTVQLEILSEEADGLRRAIGPR